MILRHATEADRAALASLDLSDSSTPWLEEVTEIVAGLLDWRADQADEGREVIVAEQDSEVVGVVAHAALVSDDGKAWPFHRYIMVTAVRADLRRTGVARLLVESLLDDLAQRGIQTAEWLVHPANVASIGFTRTVFPEAEETSPPEDRPYTRFMISL
ncbi:MAG: GNAT family N-acetyltransferase [Micrococcales bacterium]|nr:GNAT family N-acetyltransferase [Micrococcales bacterium]